MVAVVVIAATNLLPVSPMKVGTPELFSAGPAFLNILACCLVSWSKVSVKNDSQLSVRSSSLRERGNRGPNQYFNQVSRG